MDCVDNACLKAGEAEVIGAALHLWRGELIGGAVAVLAHSVKVESSGVGDAHCTGRLVKGLACGIVSRSADNFKIGVVPDLNHHCVATAYNKAEEGRLEVGVGDI